MLISYAPVSEPGAPTTESANVLETARGGPLVGREREIGEATGALEGAASGRGRLLMLVGEPGIGKTSLADGIAATAARRGFKVLWGRCWEAGGAPAYWPWLDLLSELTAMLEDGALRQALGDGASLFGELVPEVRSRVPDAVVAAEPPPDEGRFRLWRATSALLNQAAKIQPLALVLDDLHAADRSSLALLHFVARQLRPMRIVVLGTYRDVEARMDPEANELLSRISREGSTLSVARLDRGAAARFVRGRAGDVEAEVEAKILDSAQGNPLFLSEMMNLRDEQGPAAIVAGEVPRGVRDVIRQRLDRLPDAARSLLDLAAVAGDVIDLPLLVAASERDAAWVSARLTEAARAGVVAGTTTGEPNPAARRRFGHALFREVLYRELSEEARRSLHGRMAAALERISGTFPPHAEIAHHALEGPAEMLPRAVDHALRAADRAQELLAYDDAIRTLGRARDAVAAAGNPPVLCARVLLATGEARIRRGEVELGKADCREAAAIARARDDAELAARAALTYGRVFTFGLVDPVLVDMIETSLAALPPGDSAWRARLLARLAGALQPSLKAEEPVRVAREAIEIARRLGDRSALLETLHDGISALMDIVPAAEPRALNLEAERLAMELGDRERLLRTHGRLAVAHLALGAVDAADARIAAFETLASELKAPWMGWRGPMLRAVRATMEGRFDEAERLADEARRQGKAAGDPVVDAVWTTNREGLLRAAERHEELAAFEPDVCRARAAIHLAPFWQSLQSILIRTRLEQDDQVRLHLELLPEGSLSALDNLFPTIFAAEAVALVGPRDVARGLYDRISGFSGECSMLGMSYMSWEGPWARLLGLLAAYLGRWDDAWAHFENARALCRRVRARPYLARTEYEYGRALLARDAPGDRDRARALFTSARAVAVELNMPGLIRFADARLAPLGSPDAHTGEAAPAPSQLATAAPGLPFSFVLEGEYWTVRWQETTFRLKDGLGLQYLVRLFADPGREIHVLDLVGERAGAAAGEAIDTGDAGELLDEEARRSYKDRLEDLRETLAEAESFGDGARAERARAEMEVLAAELGRAVGLGGRVRRAGGAAERARSAVQRRIKNALERIGEHAPALAAYLARTVKTGNACVFRPESG